MLRGGGEGDASGAWSTLAGVEMAISRGLLGVAVVALLALSQLQSVVGGRAILRGEHQYLVCAWEAFRKLLVVRGVSTRRAGGEHKRSASGFRTLYSAHRC